MKENTNLFVSFDSGSLSFSCEGFVAFFFLFLVFFGMNISNNRDTLQKKWTIRMKKRNEVEECVYCI